MNKRILAALTLFALTLSALAGARLKEQAATAAAQAQPAQENPAQQAAQDVPDEVVYRHLFHHMVAFRKKAEELERQGKDATPLRSYFKRKANLNDEQARALDDIASDCDGEVKLLDARAKVIIDAYKAQYPGGRVPHGQAPQRPPAELRAMSEERDAIVLRYRDLVRSALGEEEFSRFHGFVKHSVAPNVELRPAGAAAPAAQPGGQQ